MAKKIVAAYDLGLNSFMLRYNLRYYARFPSDPSAQNGLGIHKSLRWIIDDLFVLLPDAANQEAARQTARIAEGFHALLDDGRLVCDDGKLNEKGQEGINAARRLWAELASASADTVSGRPLLRPWYRLGRAMGRCFLDLLDTARPRVLPSLPYLIQAVAGLPRHRVNRIDVLNKLADWDLTIASPLPLPLLCELLDEAPDSFDCYAPKVAAMHKVAKLDKKFKTILEGELDGPVDIIFNSPQPYAMFESRVHLINVRQGLILEEVIDGDGEYVSSSEMKRKHPQLEGTNFSREVNSLPEPIRMHVDSVNHYGYRWLDTLPRSSSTPSSGPPTS